MIGPDFIIIAFPKCGTTSLVENLEKHSKINMFYEVGNKESIYFHSDHMYKFGKKYYEDKIIPGKINGEKNPTYIWDHITCLNIKKKFPNIKVIIALRNPVDYLYSWYHQVYINSQCDDLECNECKKDIPTFDEFIDQPMEIKNSLFINHIIRAIDIFGKKNILFFIQENYEENSKRELDKIFNFLNIPCEKIDKIVKFKGERPNGDMKKEIRAKLLDRYESHNKALFKLIGFNIDKWNN